MVRFINITFWLNFGFVSIIIIIIFIIIIITQTYY
jgi:hypothetical protein